MHLPCLLDFLGRLLEGAGNSLVGGSGILVFFAPDHLIQLTLCPRREWFMVHIAEGNEVHVPLSVMGETMKHRDGQNRPNPNQA